MLLNRTQIQIFIGTILGLFLFLRVSFAQSNSNDLLRIHFVNVGYGDSILVQWPHFKNLLIDTGGKESSRQLVDYLKSVGVSKLDGIIISHPHENHFGGLPAILENFSIKRVFINGDDKAEEGYESLLNQLDARKIPIQVLRRGKILDLGTPEVKIFVLHPADTRQSTNDNSIATHIQFKEQSFLLTADVGIQQQEEIIELFPQIIQSDVIQIPHHGGPLSEKFIQGFQNKNFVISTGLNPWKIPNEEIIKKLSGAVYRTDRNGTVVFTSDGKTLKVDTVSP